MKFVVSKNKKPEERGGYTRVTLLHHAFKKAADNIGILKTEIPASGIASAHHHNEVTEIFYFLSPGTLFVNGEKFDADEGDVVVIEPKDSHLVKAGVDKPTKLVVLKIPDIPDDKVIDS